MRRPLPASSPVPTRSIRAARCPRPAWARCRSPMAIRRRRCLISSAPRNSARRVRLRLRPRPGLRSPWPAGAGAGRLSRRAQRPRWRRGPPAPGAQPRHQRRPRWRAADACAAVRQGRSGRCPRPRFRARPDRRSEFRHARHQRGDARQSASVAPFLQRLPSLTAGQKAAAVNLGIFPDANGAAYAYAAPGDDGMAGRAIAFPVSMPC